MKVSQLIMALQKVDADLDVYIQANKPKCEDAEGVIEPVDVLDIISVKMPNDEWRKVQVNLRSENEDSE